MKPEWKLSTNFLNVKGCERQNVKAAAKVLSWNTVARALQFVGYSNLFQGTITQNNYSVTASFIQLVNEWFDVHNSNNQYSQQPAYGTNLKKQRKTLNKMSTIKGMRVKIHVSILPFQHGILGSNSSLIQLLPYLQISIDPLK